MVKPNVHVAPSIVDEFEFYKLYRGAFSPAFDEDILELSEPMAVRQYAELFSKSFRDLAKQLTTLEHLKNKDPTDLDYQVDYFKLEKIYKIFKEFAVASANKSSSQHQDLIKALQKDIKVYANPDDPNPSLAKLFQEMQKTFDAALNTLDFVDALERKYSLEDKDHIESYREIYSSITRQLQNLQVKKPYDAATKNKIEFYTDIQEMFLYFATTTTPLPVFITLLTDLKQKDITKTRAPDAFFKRDTGHNLDEIISALEDIHTPPADLAP